MNNNNKTTHKTYSRSFFCVIRYDVTQLIKHSKNIVTTSTTSSTCTNSLISIDHIWLLTTVVFHLSRLLWIVTHIFTNRFWLCADRDDVFEHTIIIVKFKLPPNFVDVYRAFYFWGNEKQLYCCFLSLSAIFLIHQNTH